VGDDLAPAPLHGCRALDRRRRRRHPGHACRAAREAREQEALPGALEGAHRADQHRQGERLSETWSGATYERIAEAFAPIHAKLVELVAPQAGEEFLDLACGTGGVALIAARTGARVTGLDLSADQLAKARAAAAEAGLEIRFDEGDAEALPYEDASFDVVVSAFGMIFAPDHARAAGELSRVARTGARVAITSWPFDEWAQLGARIRPDYEGVDSMPWSEPDYVRGLFPELDLEFDRGPSTIAAESDEALWKLLSASVPPLKLWLDTLDDDARDDARRQYSALFDDGKLTREYVLIQGTKR
jgi:SAM-dependent methyltransferase